jgi:hypothetical protein
MVAKVNIVPPHPVFARPVSFPAHAAALADMVDALRMTPCECFDRESCRRAAAKPDNHIIFDHLDRGLGAALESVHFKRG